MSAPCRAHQKKALAHYEGIFPSFACENQLEFRNGLDEGLFCCRETKCRESPDVNQQLQQRLLHGQKLDIVDQVSGRIEAVCRLLPERQRRRNPESGFFPDSHQGHGFAPSNRSCC